MYAEGQGVEVDNVEAVRWFQDAAENGLVTAQLELSARYLKGHGVQRNFLAAMKWWLKAMAPRLVL